MKHHIGALALALVTALTLAACGTGGDDVNEADVSFAQEMIPHHEQAVEMARIARTNASSPRVKDLADRIDAGQGPEIATMKDWLEDWDESPGSMEDHSGMAGMMSEEDLDALEEARGAEFDTMFLTMMIAHHEGAIEMAETELADGENADAQALAKDVVEAQTSELAEMEELLGS